MDVTRLQHFPPHWAGDVSVPVNLVSQVAGEEKLNAGHIGQFQGPDQERSRIRMYQEKSLEVDNQ